MALGHEKLDVYRLVVGRGLEDGESLERKIELDRMAAMLSRLGKRGYSVQEESPACRIDFDSDSDFDPDGTHFQQPGVLREMPLSSHIVGAAIFASALFFVACRGGSGATGDLEPSHKPPAAVRGVTLTVTHRRDGLLDLERSKPISNISGYGFMDDDKNLLWYVKAGGRDVSVVRYSVIPKGLAGDSRMDPMQGFPEQGVPRQVKIDETLIFYLEFRKDRLPMAPSSAIEAWKLTVPPVGKEVLATRLPKGEMP